MAAAGNGSGEALHYPAGYEGVIAVGATNEQDEIAGFSNQGEGMDLVAPGVDIDSTFVLGAALEGELRSGTRTIPSRPMSFAGKGELSREFYSCGKALFGEDCPEAVAGNIALIERGDSLFSEKVRIVMDAGAVGAILYNNEEEGGELFGGSLGYAPDWIPAVSISHAEGRTLLDLGEGSEVHLSIEGFDYEKMSGTSMAAPHVAGVAALLRAQEPGISSQQVLQRMKGTAVDLGEPGPDNIFGAGRIDAAAALGRTSSAKSSANTEPQKSSLEGQTCVSLMTPVR